MSAKNVLNREKFKLLDRYSHLIEGSLGCYDRIVLTGTLTEVCHPEAVTALLDQLGIRCFDFPTFAEPLRDQIRAHAEQLAQQHGLSIEYIERLDGFRKEERIAAILAQRGDHPGLVHIFSAKERCRCYEPWHDKKTGRTGLRARKGLCLHYYFYFLDEALGLCYVRVPTWLPFRLQIYFNQHHWLANQLRRRGIGFRLEDNVFTQLADWEQAQQLVDDFALAPLERTLHALARQCCPVVEKFPRGYHWSLMQVEYALDLVFRSAAALAPIYEEISRQAILAVRAGDVARFLGKRLSPEAEVRSDFRTVCEGTRIRHQLGRNSLKMYDKRGRVLRIECTSNDVTFFRHYRKVVHRDGRVEYKQAALKKGLYSLGDLLGLLRAACERYLGYVGELEDRSPGRVDLDRISRSARDERDRSWRGFNFFLTEDLEVLWAVLEGRYQISGMSNRWLQPWLPQRSAGQIGRVLKRLRLHGLIKKVGRTYKYYLTELGQRALVAALKLKEHLIVPELCKATT